jgi:hypothetical protein
MPFARRCQTKCGRRWNACDTKSNRRALGARGKNESAPRSMWNFVRRRALSVIAQHPVRPR